MCVEMHMRKIFQNSLIDHSDREYYQYGLICSVCGTEWFSTQLEPAAYADQAEAALQAVREAEKQFHICILCGSTACNACTVSVGEIQMCRNCAERIGQSQA